MQTHTDADSLPTALLRSCQSLWCTICTPQSHACTRWQYRTVLSIPPFLLTPPSLLPRSTPSCWTPSRRRPSAAWRTTSPSLCLPTPLQARLSLLSMQWLCHSRLDSGSSTPPPSKLSATRNTESCWRSLWMWV